MNKLNPSKKTTLIAFGLFLLNGLLLTIYGKELDAYSHLPKLDFHLAGYDVAVLTQLFSAYGEKGRHFYFWLTVLDMPFPFFVALLGWSYFQDTWKNWGFARLAQLLVGASVSFLIFDLIENSLVFNFIGQYPNFQAWQVQISSLATQIKLVSLLIVYMFLPITFLVNLFRELRLRLK